MVRFGVVSVTWWVGRTPIAERREEDRWPRLKLRRASVMGQTSLEGQFHRVREEAGHSDLTFQFLRISRAALLMLKGSNASLPDAVMRLSINSPKAS